ncbi:deaminase [Blattabacterium cuenoti]|uniref:deaminase n=1 Tax=Blattabacterium cuenoti TaxID=1653831 RepID=UPI00163C0D88|nr:deaminase [Blattabacterium cuenoti]
MVQKNDDIYYMSQAICISKSSFCKKKKVGAIIVKNNKIISDGYNHTPIGFDNICEDIDGKTKWYVLHAEANAILKTSSSSLSCDGASIYITHFPCKECSKLIYLSSIKKVIYLYENNKKTNDIYFFLKRMQIKVEKLNF